MPQPCICSRPAPSAPACSGPDPPLGRSRPLPPRPIDLSPAPNTPPANPAAVSRPPAATPTRPVYPPLAVCPPRTSPPAQPQPTRSQAILRFDHPSAQTPTVAHRSLHAAGPRPAVIQASLPRRTPPAATDAPRSPHQAGKPLSHLESISRGHTPGTDPIRSLSGRTRMSDTLRCRSRAQGFESLRGLDSPLLVFAPKEPRPTCA